MYFLKLLFIFLVKDLKIYFSYKFNILIQICFVLIFLVFINYLFLSLSINFINDQSISMGKIVIGIALIDFMISCMSAFNREVRTAQQFGTFEILFQAGVSIYLVMIASYSFTFFKTTSRVLIYILICSFIFDIDFNFYNIPLFVFLMIFFSLPFIGVGLISASFIIYFKQGNPINMIVSIISIFSSGIFFSVNSLPMELHWLSDYNPLSNSIEIITSTIMLGENNSSSIDICSSYKNALIQIFLFIPIGLILVYYSFRASKLNGNLNHY